MLTVCRQDTKLSYGYNVLNYDPTMRWGRAGAEAGNDGVVRIDMNDEEKLSLIQTRCVRI